MLDDKFDHRAILTCASLEVRPKTHRSSRGGGASGFPQATVAAGGPGEERLRTRPVRVRSASAVRFSHSRGRRRARAAPLRACAHAGGTFCTGERGRFWPAAGLEKLQRVVSSSIWRKRRFRSLMNYKNNMAHRSTLGSWFRAKLQHSGRH
eukprot:gene15534-biopygen23197